MKEISQEKVVERFESLPEALQNIILGDEISNFVAKASPKNNLSIAEATILSTLLGDFVMSFATEEEFVKEVQANLGLQEAPARAVLNEFRSNVLAPVLNNIKTSEEILAKRHEEATPLRPTFAPPPVVPQKQQESPTPKAQEESEPVHEAPLIIHEEEEVEPAKEAPSYSTQRPTFYKPTFSEEYKRNTEAESAARVELGEETKKSEPQTGRTPSQPSRIVHYSEFRTPLSPFEGAAPPEPQSETPKEKPAAQIHPNNVVDLKDLPLE